MTTNEAGGGPAFEDLTARARIRDAALKHFSEDGFTHATIRGIARTAGVSPGLVRHHFGSKQALREACDDYVLDRMRRVNAQLLIDPGESANSRSQSHAFSQYVARALVDGSSRATAIFDVMVTMTEQWLTRSDERRSDTPTVDRRIRSAVITAMAAGVPLLHQQISRYLGTDMFAPEGDRVIALALLDIYSHALISGELATSAGASFDRSQQPLA